MLHPNLRLLGFAHARGGGAQLLQLAGGRQQIRHKTVEMAFLLADSLIEDAVM